MAVDHDIFEAFFQRVAGNTTLAVAYPAVSFTPPEDASWLELLVKPNRTTNYGLAVNGPKVHRGFVQINVVVRPNAGVLEATSTAEEFLLIFAKGVQLGLATVNITPWISDVVDDTQAGKVYVPVTIPYEATIINQGPQLLSEELIDADVDLDSDSGWTHDEAWTGFDGEANFDEELGTDRLLTASFVEPLLAGDHLIVASLVSINGEYLQISIDEVSAYSAFGEPGLKSHTYTAVGGETTIKLRPQGEAGFAVGTIASISMKRIL